MPPRAKAKAKAKAMARATAPSAAEAAWAAGNERGRERRAAVKALNGLAADVGVKTVRLKADAARVEAFVRTLEARCRVGVCLHACALPCRRSLPGARCAWGLVRGSCRSRS